MARAEELFAFRSRASMNSCSARVASCSRELLQAFAALSAPAARLVSDCCDTRPQFIRNRRAFLLQKSLLS